MEHLRDFTFGVDSSHQASVVVFNGFNAWQHPFDEHHVPNTVLWLFGLVVVEFCVVALVAAFEQEESHG